MDCGSCQCVSCFLNYGFESSPPTPSTSCKQCTDPNAVSCAAGALGTSTACASPLLSRGFEPNDDKGKGTDDCASPPTPPAVNALWPFYLDSTNVCKRCTAENCGQGGCGATGACRRCAFGFGRDTTPGATNPKACVAPVSCPCLAAPPHPAAAQRYAAVLVSAPTSPSCLRVQDAKGPCEVPEAASVTRCAKCKAGYALQRDTATCVQW